MGIKTAVWFGDEPFQARIHSTLVPENWVMQTCYHVKALKRENRFETTDFYDH
jgi:hypothetical protein